MKGTPITMKCPKCHRGQFGHRAKINGVRMTGAVEKKLTRSKHCGHGSGGAGFYGHRGQVECLDCGHKWYSTHPDSGRVAAGNMGGYKGAAKDFAEAKKSLARPRRNNQTKCQCGGRLLPRVVGGMVLHKMQGRWRVYEVKCEECGATSSILRKTTYPALGPRKPKDCHACGGDGWTDGSAELRRDGRKGDTKCIACGGTGKEPQA